MMVMSLPLPPFSAVPVTLPASVMLQGAGLRRRQVTRISIKGIIDVGTAERKNNTLVYALGEESIHVIML